MPTYVHSLWEDDDDNPPLDTKCKNFDIWCKSKVDTQHDPRDTLCINCAMIFGKALEQVEDIECPVCLEMGTGIRQLNCNHFSCKTCFLKMNIGMWDLDTRPVEPPHETELDEDGEEIVKLPNPEWENWNEEDYHWEQTGYAKDNTKKCPLCRQ